MESQGAVHEPLHANAANVDDGADRSGDAPQTSVRATLAAVSSPFWVSRLIVFIAGAVGASRVAGADLSISDPGKLLVAGLNRWDSRWYLSIARHGYGAPTQSKPYFPLYPLLIRAVGFATGDVYAGVIVSLVAFFAALFLLHRLVALDFSAEVATATVALVAFCPIAFFFSAVYTESLFLALTVGAIYAARRERWLLAGLAGAFASATRNEGILVALPIVIIYLYGPRGDAQAQRSRWHSKRDGIRALLPRYRLEPRIWPVLLVPAGVIAYTVYLALKYHAGTSWISDERYWHHHSSDPLSTLVQGARYAWFGLGGFLGHPSPPFTSWYSALNTCDFVACLLGLAVLISCVRTLPTAYWAYAVVTFVLPLASPVRDEPLNSFPRYEMIIFPLFICVARFFVRRGWTTAAITAGGISLAILSCLFGTGRWIA